MASLTERSHSTPSGSGTVFSKPEPSTSPKRSNIENCPAARVFCRLAAASMMFSGFVLSTKRMSCMRVYPVESKAPEQMSASTTRRLAWPESMRSTKSWRLAKGPFFSRSAMMASPTPSPTPRMPAKPKRTPSGTAVKSRPDSLMSGGRMATPSWR